MAHGRLDIALLLSAGAFGLLRYLGSVKEEISGNESWSDGEEGPDG